MRYYIEFINNYKYKPDENCGNYNSTNTKLLWNCFRKYNDEYVKNFLGIKRQTQTDVMFRAYSKINKFV